MKLPGKILVILLCLFTISDVQAQDLFGTVQERSTSSLFTPLPETQCENFFSSESEMKKKKRRKKKKKRGRGGEQNDLGMLISFDYMFGIGKGVGFTPFFTLGKENATIRFGFHFTTPVKFNDYVYGYAMSNMTQPNQIEIPVKYKYSMFALGVDYKRFFFGGSPADGGFYGFAGAGASYIPLKATMDDYDETLYYTTASEKERYFQPNLRFGLGGDIWLSSFGLTFEGMLALPANQVMGMEYEIQLPPYVSLSVGAKFGL
jgi:hypothetical protein